MQNKIKIIFWSLIFSAIFLLLTVIFLISDRNLINEKLNAYNTEISILEEIKEQEKNWRTLEDAIKEKKELIEAEKWQLELLEKNKMEVQEKIQENRQKFFWKKEDVK